MTTKQLIRDVIIACLIAFVSFMLGLMVATTEVTLEYEAKMKHAIDSVSQLQGI